MAIYIRKRKLKTVYQCKVRDSNNKWLTKSFSSFKEAKAFEAKLVSAKLNGEKVCNASRLMTLNSYWQIWEQESRGSVTKGWRTSQTKMYDQYVCPVLGDLKLGNIKPSHIRKVLQLARDKGRSDQTLLHIYSMLHKVFKDAIEDYELISSNPVRRKFKPKLVTRESKHLTVGESKKLLEHVRERPFGVAIWIALFAGLRVGEIQALKWKNVDLENGVIHVRATYARKEKTLRDYPKGRKWHSPVLPKELLSLLKQARIQTTAEFVCPSPQLKMFCYNSYMRALKRYCEELNLPAIATHGLRHSTAALYQKHGATKDDLRELFAHSSTRVTDRYIHGKNKNLERLANVIELFKTGSDS